MQRKPLPPYSQATEYIPNDSPSPEIDISNYHGSRSVEANDNRYAAKESSHVTSTFLTEDSTINSQKTAKWGISWLGEPLQIPLYTFLGIGLAVAHHLVYLKLDGSEVGESEFGQQAVKQIGNVFVFLALASFKVAIDESYNQYIWYAMRKRSFAIDTLDKLFTLPYRITAIFSWRLLGGAKIAALLGLLTWLLFLGGLTPAATLSVVPALLNSTSMQMVPILDFKTSSWWQFQTVNTFSTIDPTAINMKTATSAAVGGAVIPPSPPSANSSFSVQFYGPTVQCGSPDAGQKAAFDIFENAFSNASAIVTTGSLKNVTGNGRTARGFLIMSAFSPTQNLLDEPYRREDILKAYNNWLPELGANYSNYLSQIHQSHHQIWVQTGDRDIVCSLVNASFDVGFSYLNGAGTVTHQHVTVLPPAGFSNTSALSIGYSNAASGSNKSDQIESWQNSAYYASFLALGTNLFGNVSLENSTLQLADKFINLSQASSRVLQTDLTGCDDFVNSYWTQNLAFNTTGIFPRHPGSCRNKTLDRALEDLANNITISMLSVPAMTSQISVPVRVGITSNIYEYERIDLLISYGAVIFVTLFCVAVGVICLLSNGVYHTTNFSAVMATTRNPDLDHLVEGACLGTDKGMMDRKLMFGVVTGSEFGREVGRNGSGEAESGLKHAAFGLTGTVMKIKKGTVCA